MLLNDKKVERLGIFVFYDKEGIVDDYVIYLLKSLKEAVNEIIIVSNTNLSPSEKSKLSPFTERIKIRENIGLDAGAFKDTYDEYQEYIREFDEVILLNDTFFGPFIPFKKIVKEMSHKDIDFWGLTANYDSPDGFGYLPDKMIHSHIQTFFIAFRKNVLNSDAFNDYFKNYNIKKMKKFNDVVTKHEIAFTHYLENAGFKWDVFTDLSKYKSDKLEENFNTYAYTSYDLIKNCHCPFLKKKNFCFPKSDVLYLSKGDDLIKTLKYIEENNLYDIDMIYQSIIRLYNTEDIYYNLNMYYIVKESNNNKKVAVVLILEEEKYLEYYIDFLKKTKIKNIFVFTENKNIKKELENNKIKVSLKSEFDSTKYDYIGIINDFYKKYQQIKLPYKENLDIVINNGFESQNYINGITDIFLENKYIGLLVLPISYHSNYFTDIANKYDLINCNINACFIKSSIFSFDIVSKDYFVQELLKELKKHKLLVGKVINEKSVANTLINQEYTIKKTYHTLCHYHSTNTNSITEATYHLKHSKAHRTILTKILRRLYRYMRKFYYMFFWK